MNFLIVSKTSTLDRDRKPVWRYGLQSLGDNVATDASAPPKADAMLTDTSGFLAGKDIGDRVEIA